MPFRLVPKSSTLDDLELLYVQFFAEFCAIVGMFERLQRLNENEDRPTLSAAELLRTESTFQRCIDYVDIAGQS